MVEKARKITLNQFSLKNMVEHNGLYQETLQQKQCRRNRLTARRATLDLLKLCTSATISAETKGRVTGLVHGTIDWEYFLSLASFHGISPLVYNSLTSSGIANLVPPNYLNVLKWELYQTLCRNTVLAAETKNVISTFGRHGIEAIPLKGVMLAESLYGNLAVRPTSDIDLLVRSRDIVSARTYLKEANYQMLTQTKNRPDSGHAFHGAPYFKNGDSWLLLELHWDLTDSKTVHFPETEMWSRARQSRVNGNHFFTLSHEDNLMFLAYHLTKHDTHLLKYLCDVSELVKKYSNELDWDYVSTSARAWGADIALYYSLKKAKEILGAPVPQSYLEAIKPNAMRRWLLERLMPSEAFVAARKRERLRKETISIVHSLMMRRPRQMAAALVRPRRGMRGAIPRTCAWTSFVLATSFGSYLAGAILSLNKRPDSRLVSPRNVMLMS